MSLGYISLAVSSGGSGGGRDGVNVYLNAIVSVKHLTSSLCSDWCLHQSRSDLIIRRINLPGLAGLWKSGFQAATGRAREQPILPFQLHPHPAS